MSSLEEDYVEPIPVFCECSLRVEVLGTVYTVFDILVIRSGHMAHINYSLNKVSIRISL